MMGSSSDFAENNPERSRLIPDNYFVSAFSASVIWLGGFSGSRSWGTSSRAACGESRRRRFFEAPCCYHCMYDSPELVVGSIGADHRRWR